MKVILLTALAIFMLSARKPPETVEPDPTPPPDAKDKVFIEIPNFHRARRREVRSEMLKRANEMVFQEDTPFETIEVHGRWAIGIEHHFHPPGGEFKPWGWHKGGTVFIKD